jgi:beta-lactam-binding protein with PASTA domain
MRALLVGTVLAMTLAMSACGDDDSSDVAATETTATETAVSVAVPDIVGDSVEDATATLEAAGLTMRIVRRDGEDLAATADFVENRVNVAVETKDGTEVVTEVLSTG